MSKSTSRAPMLILGIAAVAIVAAAAGAVVGLSLTSPSRVAAISDVELEPPPEPRIEEPVPDESRERRRVGEPVEEAAAPAGGESPPADRIVLGRDEFLDAYRSAFERAAGRLPDPEQEEAAWARARTVVAGVAHGAGGYDGHQDAENRREIEIGERDDIMAFLTDDDRQRDLRALRNDPFALAKLFAHRVTGPTTDGPTRLNERTDLVDDGTTLVFGPGVHAPKWNAIGDNGNQMPRDLTIQGAGMDSTLIRLSDFAPRDVVWNLHLRDCTIDCGNDGAFDLRNREASVYAERVRFVRFDAGHGGCDLFTAGGEGGAVYARFCEFAGGYGKSPGCGNILRGIEMARFEDCTFERITYSIFGGHNSVDGAAFVRCVFRDCPSDVAILESASGVKSSIVVEDCTTEWTLPEENRRQPPSRDQLSRDLAAKFPGVGDR